MTDFTSNSNSNMSGIELDDNDEQDYVDKDDFFVKRDGEGNLLPQTVTAKGYGNIEVIPMTYGQAEDYFGSGGTADVGPGAIAKILKGHITKPDLSNIDKDTIRYDMEPMAPQALLLAVVEASGVNADVDVDESGEATVELAGN